MKKFLVVAVIMIAVLSTAMLVNSQPLNNQVSLKSSFDFVAYNQSANNISDFKVFFGYSYVTIFNYIRFSNMIPTMTQSSIFHPINRIYGGFYWIGMGNITLVTPFNIGDMGNFTVSNFNLHFRIITNGNISGILLSRNPIESEDGYIYINSDFPTFVLFSVLPLMGNINLMENNESFTNGNNITLSYEGNFIEDVGVEYGNITIEPINRISLNGNIEDNGYLLHSSDQLVTVFNEASPYIDIYNILGNVSISLNDGYSLNESGTSNFQNNSMILPLVGKLDLGSHEYDYYYIMLNNTKIGLIYAPADSTINGNNLTVDDPMSLIKIYLLDPSIYDLNKEIKILLMNQNLNYFIALGKEVSFLSFNNSYLLNYKVSQNLITMNIMQGQGGIVFVEIPKYLEIKGIYINGNLTDYQPLANATDYTLYEVQAPYEGPVNLTVGYYNLIEKKIHDLFNSFLFGGIVLIVASISTILFAFIRHRNNTKRIITDYESSKHGDIQNKEREAEGDGKYPKNR